MIKIKKVLPYFIMAVILTLLLGLIGGLSHRSLEYGMTYTIIGATVFGFLSGGIYGINEQYSKTTLRYS